MSDTGPSGGRRCLNCEQPLHGEFCSHCGQRDLPTRRALGELVREAVGEALQVDGRVPRTLVPFLFNPGRLIRDYNAGRRARYTSPFRLFLATTLLWLASSLAFGLGSATDEDPGSAGVVSLDLPPDFTGPEAGIGRWVIDRMHEYSQLPQAEQVRRSRSAIRETAPKAALALVPVFALLAKVLFWSRRRPRFYAEHLVFALVLHAFAFLLLAIGLAADGLEFGLAALAVLVVYLYACLWRGYEAGWWASLMRLLAILIVYPILLTLVASVMLIGNLLID